MVAVGLNIHVFLLGYFGSSLVGSLLEVLFNYYHTLIVQIFLNKVAFSAGIRYNLCACSEGRVYMSKVVVKDNEALDEALRRFKRQVSRNGTLAEARKREYYVKPGVRKKMKSEAARKANRKKR